MIRRALLASFAVATALAAPNFSGNWKLNLGRSDYGPFPAPASRSEKIEHVEPDIKVNMTASGDQGSITAEFQNKTNGEETTNDFRGAPMKTTAKWDGDTLVLDSRLEFNGAELAITDRWQLSGDGKSLTIRRHLKSPRGEADQKIVLEKQ